MRAATGGGITRQTLRITNVGYRLLRSTARIEPPATRWVRLRPEHDGRPFNTIDQTDLPVELELPETIDRPLVAQIVIESNGGTRRIGVRIERPAASGRDSRIYAAGTAPLRHCGESNCGQVVARVRPGARIAIGCAAAVALRLMVVLLNRLPSAAHRQAIEPRLISVAIILVGAGMIAGLALARRRGEWRDYPGRRLRGRLARALDVRRLVRVASERRAGARFLVDIDLGDRLASGALGALLVVDLITMGASLIARTSRRSRDERELVGTRSERGDRLRDW